MKAVHYSLRLYTVHRKPHTDLVAISTLNGLPYSRTILFHFIAVQHQIPLKKNQKDEVIVTSHLSNLPEGTESFLKKKILTLQENEIHNSVTYLNSFGKTC